jgi:putative FmdB family regulatory protein
MPIYEYSCEPCSNKWKEMHGSDDKGGRCPDCGVFGKRSLSTNSIIIASSDSSTPGQRVEKHIEQVRELVKQDIQEARKEYKI